MDSYKNMREQNNKIDAELKKTLEAARKLEKEKDAPTEQLRVATGYLRASINASISGMVSRRTYDINLTKAALDYAAASINLTQTSSRGKTKVEPYKEAPLLN